jgi:glycosyltransferase involved in cell wall biosynthesis
MITTSARLPTASIAPAARLAHRIFIIHPSRLFTDNRPHGDGLLAYRYVVELAARGHTLAVACEEVDLREPLPANVELYPFSARAENDAMRRIRYAWEMRKLFARLHARHRFDLAHQLNPVFTGLSLGLTGVRIPLVLGPYVAHWYDDRSRRLPAVLGDAISRLQQRGADAAVVASRAARERIIDRRLRKRATFVVPYGIDLDAFPQRPLPPGDPVILYLNWLAEKKGIFVLLDAFDRVAARIPRVRLRIAGDGEERERVASAVRSSKYAGQIELLGKLSRQQVVDALAASTVYCLPSFGEPYGMSVVEAMATARPVVATAAGGPTELLDTAGGRLVRVGDPAALGDALVEVLETPGLAEAMGVANREAVRAFDWPRVIDQIEAVYAIALGSRR